MGNVLATITDKKVGIELGTTDTVDYFEPDVATANDYYPGGMLMPGRKYGTLGRYGFNGKEQDSEVKGEGAQYDYGFRIYDPRVVRFLSVDPLFQTYPWYTPYQFAGNMPIWAIDLDGLEEMKANSVANVIKDINGNIVTTPTVVNDQSSSADVIPGVRRLNSNQIEVTPGLIGEKHPYWNTFTWQQINGKDFTCLQSITPIGGEAGGTVKPPKTNLQQDNDDVPPVTNRPTTVITPINNNQVQNQTLTRNINFVPGEPNFATPADAATVNQVAGVAPNSRATGRPVTTTNGNTTTTTTTTRQVRSIITIDLMTMNPQNMTWTRQDNGQPTNAVQSQTDRYNTIRQQLINQGTPARNIRRGTTQYGVPRNQMNGNVNQTIFRVRTTRTRTTTGTSTTTE